MTDKKVQAIVPRNVYDFIERLREEDPALLSSIAGIGKLAKDREEKVAARWIKLNPITYGVGYWGGFVPEDENNLAKNNLEEKPARKRKRIPPQEDKNE